MIKKFLAWLRPKHICRFTKPLVSQYWSFNTRAIIYECSCGKRKKEEVYRRYEDPFPIPTTHLITCKEMDAIEAGGPVPNLFGIYPENP